MSFLPDSVSNKQEKVTTASDPKPFNPKDEARVAELSAKFEDGKENQETFPKFEVVPEDSVFKLAFGNATILKKEDGTYYALRRDSRGDLSASEFTMMRDGDYSRVGAVYQVHNMDQFGEISKKTEIKKFESLSEEEAMGHLKEKEASVDSKNRLDKVNLPLMELFRSAGYESFHGQVDNIKESINKLSEDEQEKLAETFFEQTIGKNIMNVKSAYQVYMQVGGVFHKKFKELEDTRLKAAGYSSGFTL